MPRYVPEGWTAARLDRAIDVAVTSGVSVLVLVGFATSYHTLLDLAATVGAYPRWLAPAVPLSFDLGIIVLSLKVAQAAREGRHAPFLRLLVIVLSAVTVVANASAVPGTAARLLHAVPPAMFVVCFESVIVTVRRHALQARGAWPESIPRQHPLRWLLAPRSTSTSWRRSVLEGPPQRALATPMRRDAIRSLAAGPKGGDVGGSPGADRTARSVVGVVRSREAMVVAALDQDGALTAAALQSRLAEEGYELSLRTVQRLRAAALNGNVT